MPFRNVVYHQTIWRHIIEERNFHFKNLFEPHVQT
jgi:hypothetical protein